MVEQGKVMTVKDLADLLKVNPETIYRGAKAGRIPHRRIGRAIRFSQQDVDAYLQTVKVGGECQK